MTEPAFKICQPIALMDRCKPNPLPPHRMFTPFYHLFFSSCDRCPMGRPVRLLGLCLWFAMAGPPLLASPIAAIDPQTVDEAMAGRQGVFYLVDVASGAAFDSDPTVSGRRFPPCSTFKVWNALCGFELGLLSSPMENFYEWDGVERAIPAWNQNLNLREAFQASCVPAFQQLARRIGNERMDRWLGEIQYGNGDTSAGLDVFWLPGEGRSPILISASEQADLLRDLEKGRLPASEASIRKLYELMEVARTPRAILYGKTGSSGDAQIGWFIGMLETDGKRYTFACLLSGQGAQGAEARAVVEKIFAANSLL